MSGSNSPTQVKPVKDYEVTNSPILDHSQKVEEFVTRAQPEASRPTRPRLHIVTNWHNNKPKAMGQGADYTNKNNNNNNDWNKPSGNTIRDESLADPFIAENKPISGNTIRDESLTDPFIAKNKPSSGNTIRDESLTDPFIAKNKPSSGNTILDESLTDPFIAKNKEAAKPWAVPASAPAAPQPRMTVLDSTVPKRDTYIATIDSREAQRRYGGTLDPSSRPIQAQETYTGTIDSKEAERKYNGRRIP
ncbi:hypothetical protein TEA_016615 [Camellia sinensis var. sinensis]|uniref:Uncharacterized protein n=1 Tax=Camellia sinensis var. sinensis TaxID=542762 RepID=A0A4S4DUD6_CAMSN|nr:hypothetical protein TEA_016615 [Camellia sinensis var. sinensis]